MLLIFRTGLASWRERKEKIYEIQLFFLKSMRKQQFRLVKRMDFV